MRLTRIFTSGSATDDSIPQIFLMSKKTKKILRAVTTTLLLIAVLHLTVEKTNQIFGWEYLHSLFAVLTASFGITFLSIICVLIVLAYLAATVFDSWQSFELIRIYLYDLLQKSIYVNADLDFKYFYNFKKQKYTQILLFTNSLQFRIISCKRILSLII